MKMTEKMINKINKNLTLFALTLTCFWVAAERIYSFYITSMPIGSVGDCYSVHYITLEKNWQMKILENDWQNKLSLVEMKLLDENNYIVVGNYSFTQQRQLTPKRIECK
jgi:hypothetical protein